MKRYTTLQCNTCSRKKDELIDLTHYAPDRCTITLGCEGRLTPVGYTSEGSTILGVPPAGLTNWAPRGSTVTGTVALKADPMYDTSTGTKKQIVLAVANDTLGFVPSDTAVVTLNFVTEQQSAKDYRQYTYRRSNSFTIVNGIEDNQAKKVLRYNISGGSADQVDVYVNGVKRERGTAADQYQLYDGVGSVVPPNSVLFNTTITGGSTQVDVVVSKAAAVSTASLNFVRAIDDEARVNTGAWEGVHSVNSPAHGGLYSLFVCDFSENHALALDVKLRVDPQIPSIVVDVPGGSPFIITNAAILLSRAKSFTQIDRQRAKWVPLTKLNSETEYMVVKLVDNARALFITEASTVNLFPVIEAVRFGSPKLQTQNLLGDPDAAELDNDLISGPDA